MNVPLRIIFAGIPDAGKSTLIGRLLLATNSVYEDQHQNDLSYYTDGLQSEQEEGRTIDVAYRTIHLESGYRCILIDTPGHSELVSNFVSGASYADLMFYLIDSTRPRQRSIHLQIAESMNLPIVNIATKVTQGIGSLPVNFAIDSVTGTGVDELLKSMEVWARSSVAQRKNLRINQNGGYEK